MATGTHAAGRGSGGLAVEHMLAVNVNVRVEDGLDDGRWPTSGPDLLRAVAAALMEQYRLRLLGAIGDLEALKARCAVCRRYNAAGRDRADRLRQQEQQDRGVENLAYVVRQAEAAYLMVRAAAVAAGCTVAADPLLGDTAAA